MGNCLFIPSEEKIEYRNPCLFPGVGFTEALAASFTRSIPPALALAEIKKCYSRNPADSCLSNTQPYNCTTPCTQGRVAQAHGYYLQARRMTRTRWLVNLWWWKRQGQRKIENSHHRKWKSPSNVHIIDSAITLRTNIALGRIIWASTESHRNVKLTHSYFT